jgi:prolyl 4-hydroxylase
LSQRFATNVAAEDGRGRHLPDDIFLRDGFLSSSECREILSELQHAFWKPSLTYQLQTDDTYRSVLTDERVSETAHQEIFGQELVEMLAPIEERLTECFDVDPASLEWWQATRYPIGGVFNYHLDAGTWDGYYAGERVRTFLVFLTTPLDGGGTDFRALDLLVDARAGRLLAWNNLFADGRTNHSMIHAGTPLRDGEKVTLVTWQRQKRFRPL